MFEKHLIWIVPNVALNSHSQSYEGAVGVPSSRIEFTTTRFTDSNPHKKKVTPDYTGSTRISHGADVETRFHVCPCRASLLLTTPPFATLLITPSFIVRTLNHRYIAGLVIHCCLPLYSFCVFNTNLELQATQAISCAGHGLSRYVKTTHTLFLFLSLFWFVCFVLRICGNKVILELSQPLSYSLFGRWSILKETLFNTKNIPLRKAHHPIAIHDRFRLKNMFVNEISPI